MCLAWCCLSLLDYRSFQHAATHAPSSTGTFPALRADKAPVVLGQLTVPRIGLSVAMVEGDDDDSLAVAAGHMPGTAMVGRVGNMVIAGHRDSAFWPLRHIKLGDRIQVKGASPSTYVVDQTKIVDPTDTGLLADTQSPVLTLVTCYPFRFVGPAPKRFMVRARLLH